MYRESTVGILTFHRCINYGSYWQARCLVEGIRRLGYGAVLLDHRSARIDRAEWQCALNPTARQTTIEDRRAYSEKMRRFFHAFDALPTSPAFAIDHPQEADEYGLVVVGSDEVWNLRHPWYGGHPLFYGEGLKGDLASYAASFGNYNSSDGLDPPWRDRLRSFDAISVRDRNSHNLVAGALEQPPELVLDPCLQFPDVIDPVLLDRPEPYALVYGHSFPHWFRDEVQQWATARNLTLLSVGYRNSWADEQLIEAGPQEFAGLIAGATAVITNFFHGCVFSLINDKPFACVPSDYRSNKVRDLLDMLGASDRLIVEGSADQLSQVLACPAGSTTYDIISDMRRTSGRYLHHVLG